MRNPAKSGYFTVQPVCRGCFATVTLPCMADCGTDGWHGSDFGGFWLANGKIR
jgi:hypothetical protein